jgi:hypothetical protein
MKLLRFAKGVFISVASLLLMAGGVAYPVECGTDKCCAMPEIADDPGIHQGHCGCGCGQFEEPQVPDQSAETIATLETGPVQTDHDYYIENESVIVENADSVNSNLENNLHSPPLILDNKYTPLLC